ncbi:nuclear transport factor 2 family protein [Devosia sp. XK-2]|uniref:YybH family protein n=1 Tax=Devosia sp. XK-2 TaxID=3126689 RepID=UPI0030CC7AD7
MGFTSPQAAMAFYGEVINEHRFDALLPMLSKDVVFWFSSGSHCGVDAARRAFEKTWRRIADEFYWIEDLSWLCQGDGSAACLYRFGWRGLVDGKLTQGGGRGTSVLRLEPDGWKVVHEHLSAEPVDAG